MPVKGPHPARAHDLPTILTTTPMDGSTALQCVPSIGRTPARQGRFMIAKARTTIRHCRPAATVAASIVLALLVLPANAAWLRAESEHVVVYGDGGEADVRAFTRKLERFHSLLELMLPGLDPGQRPKLPVYMVRTRSDLRDAMPEAPEDLGGMYSASADGVHAFAIARRAGAREGDDILLHEYTHHFMIGRTRGVYPTWFVEGFAEYYATADVSGERITVGMPSPSQLGVLQYVPWIGFDEVLTGSPWRMPSRKRAAFYAQSWLLTHYLLRDGARWAATRAYFRAVRSGTPPLEAWTTHVGIDLERLRTELTRYAQRHMQYSVLNTILPEPVVAVTALPASADALMLPAIGLQFGAAPASTLDTLRAGPARFPGDAFAIELAARAELADGKPGRAVELITPLLGEAATAEQLFMAGLANMAAAQARSEAEGAAPDAGEDDYVTAGNLFVRAVRADPMHFRALYRYWQVRTRSREYPDTRLQDVLVQAYNLAPQAKEIAITTGFMLLGVERAKEARTVLASIASDPHGAQAGTIARRLVALVDSLPDGRNPTPTEIAAAVTGEAEDTPEEDEGTRVPPQPNEA